MRLAAQDLQERARWLVSLRWIACLGVLLAVWGASFRLGLIASAGPLYAIAFAMIGYNLALSWICRRGRGSAVRRGNAKAIIVVQIALDLIALTALLYFADISRNPFILYFVFHIILASILLPGWTPYLLAIMASLLVGAVLLLQASGLIPRHSLLLPGPTPPYPAGPVAGGFLLPGGVVLALATTLIITVFLTTSVSRYVERVQGQIRQQQKMLGIGQLVAGFAHQISNPLDGLQNGLRQIEHGVRGNGHLEETARLMTASLGRIEKVARRLQEFARPQGLELRPCDANKAVEAVLQLFDKNLGERGVVVEKDLAAVPPVWGDPYSIEEILFNLCTNALDAMPDGGRLLIRTYVPRRGDVSAEDQVAVEVQDSGIGVPPDRLEKIFEPFYTTKAQSGGTGLGLGLCRMLLSEMSGRIEVDSVPSKGSTFRMLLGACPERRS